MVSIIPPKDPFGTPLAQNIARAGQAFAGIHQQRQQGKALGKLLKATDPERFGDLDVDAFARLSPNVSGQIAKNSFSSKQQQNTPTQRASQINKVADTQVKEILNNFRGPLGEIRFTGKKGEAAKKAIRMINQNREKKLKAIFGDDLPGLDAEELDVVSGFLGGDFDKVEELPGEVADSEGGFFQGILNWFRSSPPQSAVNPEKGQGKVLTDNDKKRIVDAVKKNNPNATRQLLMKLAEKKAKEEGFEF